MCDSIWFQNPPCTGKALIHCQLSTLFTDTFTLLKRAYPMPFTGITLPNPTKAGGGPPAILGITSHFESLTEHSTCKTIEFGSKYFLSPVRISNEITPVLETAVLG